MDSEKYISFIEDESEFISQERLYCSGNELFDQLTKTINELKNSHADIRAKCLDFIEKNIIDLLSVAPHLALQFYTNCLMLVGKESKIAEIFEELAKKEEVPAKCYGIIQRYISAYKTRETVSPFKLSSDENIIEAVDSCNVKKITRVLFYIQMRLKLGTNMDYFVDLLNPFFENEDKDPLFKVTFIDQLKRLDYSEPATKEINLKTKIGSHKILLDLEYDESLDTFLLAIKYYIDNSKDAFAKDETICQILLTFATHYRTLHLKEEHLLNTEKGIKSFCCCLIKNVYSNISKNYKDYITFPEEYKNENGWNEALLFMKEVYISGNVFTLS